METVIAGQLFARYQKECKGVVWMRVTEANIKLQIKVLGPKINLLLFAKVTD